MDLYAKLLDRRPYLASYYTSYHSSCMVRNDILDNQRPGNKIHEREHNHAHARGCWPTIRIHICPFDCNFSTYGCGYCAIWYATGTLRTCFLRCVRSSTALDCSKMYPYNIVSLITRETYVTSMHDQEEAKLG